MHEAPEFELWLDAERERLATLYVRLLERIIALHKAAGQWDAVMNYARRALSADPLHEAIHLALIEAQVRLGQRAQAAQQYAALVNVLKRELDVAPLPETTAHYEALLAGQSTAPVRHTEPSLSQHEPRTPFVGRAAELAVLDDELARANAGSARIVLITGDMGLGKTRLWQAWAERHTNEIQMAATHALETSEPVPFGPVLRLFRQPGALRTLLQPSPSSSASASALSPIWLSELSRLLPEIGPAWPNLPAPLALSPAADRVRLLQALTEAIRAAGQTQSLLVIIIDDLHWADPSTLDWLVVLVDQFINAPLLVIGTYRPQDAPERLNNLAAGWQRQGRLRTIALPHLTADESFALLAAKITPEDRERFAHWVQQSGGNPYFLMELSRAQFNADAPPDDLAALIRARLRATVPASALQVIQAAAVLGDEADFALLKATSGRSEDETLDALDALTSTVLTARDGTYDFVHPLVATVVRHDLTPARKAFLHRRAAQALERANVAQPARVARQLMEHYAAADEFAQAAHYAELAAVRAFDLGAFVEGADYARRALGWQPTPERHLLLGQALSLSGTNDEAQDHLEAAVHGFEQADDPVGITRASLLLASTSMANNDPHTGKRWLARAPIERAQVLDPKLGAEVYQVLAGIERQSQEYDAAAEHLDHAARLASLHGLPALEGQIDFERGNLLADRGDRQAALAAFGDALRLAQASANPITMAMAHNNLAYHSLLAGDVAQAEKHIRAATEITARHAIGLLWQFVYSTTGEIALAQGKLDEADTAFAKAYAEAHARGNRVHQANLRINQAAVARARGDQDRAVVLLTEARDLLGDAADSFVHDKLARALAESGAQGI